MEKEMFKVGYTTYLQKPESKKKNWTSKVIAKVIKNKLLLIIGSIIIACIIMNFWLIYQFINILENF